MKNSEHRELGKNGRFRRRREDFVCDVCGEKVEGNGYTDHCPKCLNGKHVDINPGDRASDCGGPMKPIYTVYSRDHFIIYYRCIVCGKEWRVRSAANDNREKMTSLMVKGQI